MHSPTLKRIGLSVVVAALVIAGCQAVKDEEQPLGIRAFEWQDTPVELPADGFSEVELMVTAITTEGMKVQNVAVTFSKTGGSTTGRFTQATVITDANGEASTTLIAPESATDVSTTADAAVTDTTGYVLNPRTMANVEVGPAPEGTIAFVSVGPMTEEQLGARLHAHLLEEAQERAESRRRGLSALVPTTQGGGAGEAAVQASSLTVNFLGVQIQLTSSKTQLPADGISTSAIEARVRTGTGSINVSSAEIEFTAKEGKITAGAVTDQFGIARATLTSAITTAARDTVRARLGGLTASLVVTYDQPELTITADETGIPADRTSTTAVRARLLTPSGNPIVGAQVDFTLAYVPDTPGDPNDTSLTIQGTTNSSGEAIATLKAGQNPGTATVTASFSSRTAAVDVGLLGLVVTLSSEKSSILANGTSTTRITLIAKTQTTNVALDGREVVFSTDLGTIPISAITTSSGVATTTLTSAITPGTAKVKSFIGGRTDSVTVDFTATANVTVEVTAEDDRLLRDGSDETTVTARVVDGEGSPLAGRVVTFALTGNGSLSTSQPQQTNASGQASVVLAADAASADGSATVTATAEGENGSIIIPLRGVSLTLTSTAATLVANGTNTAKFSLLVKETTTNAAVPGRLIQFASDLGTIPATATTNASGVAEVTFNAGTSSGTATITATLGTLNATKTIDLVAEALNLTLQAEAAGMLRDGVAEVDLTVTVQDPNGNLLNNRDVTWSVTGGSASVFPALGRTGSTGFTTGTHKTTLTADAAGTDQNAVVTVTVGDSTKTSTILMKGITLASFVQPDTILANGITTAQYTWQATETTSGTVIPSHIITIQKISGPSVILTNVSGTTTSSGIATADVKSTTNAGDLVLRANLGGVTNDASLHLLADAYSLDLTAGTATLLRDGQETSELTATLVDKFGDPVVDQRIDFSLTGNGTLNRAFQNTDADGEAVVTLRSDIGTTNANARVFAVVSTIIDSVDVPLYGVTLSIKAAPTTLVADGEDESSVEVTVKEAGSNTPLVGRLVTFSFTPGTFGTITAQGTTDSRGIATATLTADTTASLTGTVTGRLGADPATTLSVSTNVSIVAPVRNVTLSSAEDRVLRNNQDTSDITAYVTDNNGDPVSGEPVAWSLVGSSPAGASLSVVTSRTDALGNATVTLKGDADTADGTAEVRGAVGTAADTLGVTLQGITLTVAAAPKTIAANAVATSEITATLVETSSGRGVESETITFATTLGTIGGTATTDANGQATVNLKAGLTAGTATVTAYSGPIATGISITTTVALATPVAASVALISSATDLQVKGTGGLETATITATVLDRDNQVVPEGTLVDFELTPSTAGTFVGSATRDTVETDADGQAVISFQSGTVATDVTIVAKVLGTSVQGSSSLLTVTAGPTVNIDVSATVIDWNDDGLYERELTAILSDTYGNTIPNTNVVWTLSPDTLGAIVGPSVTNEQGAAHSVLVYQRGDEPLPLDVSATNQGVTGTLSIPQGYIYLTVESGSTTLLRDGSDNVELKAEVLDGFGTKVGLLGVSWSVTGTGSLLSSGTATDENGEAAGNNFYIADAATADVLDTVQVAFGGITASRGVTLEGITVEILSVEPDTLSANGKATAAVTARLKKTTDLSVLSGYPLTFTTDLGTIAASGVTGTDGTAAVTFTAGTTTGTATITAARSTVTDTAPLELITSNSTAIALESSVDALDVKGTGGEEIATITVTVWDEAGQPVPNGTSVTLTASSGTFSTGEASRQKLTGSNGIVSFTYQSGTASGTVTFTATSGTATGSAALITVASGPANSILLGYDTAATTPVNGISTVTISALVADTYGNAVATDSQVFFEIIAGGTGNAVITPVATTDETGLAEATLSYPDTEITNTINVQVTCDGVVQTIMVTLP